MSIKDKETEIFKYEAPKIIKGPEIIFEDVTHADSDPDEDDPPGSDAENGDTEGYR